MKQTNKLLGTLFALLLIISCSSEDEPTNQQTLVGSWSGALIQPEFGELNTVFNISTVNGSDGTGTGSFTSGDLTNCDDTQFNCSDLFCNFQLDLVSNSGTKFTFDQVVQGTSNTCGDGVFEITVVNASTINVTWYEELYPENKATGSMTKN